MTKKLDETPEQPKAFSGEGATLKRRPAGSLQPSANGRPVTPVKPVKEEEEEKPDPWAKLGGGNSLSTKGVKKEDMRGNRPVEVIDATMLDEDDFFGGEEDDEEYDDVIEIDSD